MITRSRSRQQQQHTNSFVSLDPYLKQKKEKKTKPASTKINHNVVPLRNQDHPGKRVAFLLKERRHRFLEENNLPDDYFEREFYEDAADTPPSEKKTEQEKETSLPIVVVDPTSYDRVDQNKDRVFFLQTRPWYNHDALNAVLQEFAPGSHVVAPQQEHCPIVVGDDRLTLFDSNTYLFLQKFMDHAKCHNNVEELLAMRWGGITNICTGYALSADGLWRYHSWGLDANRGVVIETTDKRVAYYGVILL